MIYKCTECFKDYYVSEADNINPVKKIGVCVHCKNLSQTQEQSTLNQPIKPINYKKIFKAKGLPKESKIPIVASLPKGLMPRKKGKYEPSIRFSTVLTLLTLVVVLIVKYVVPNIDTYLGRENDYIVEINQDFSYTTTLSLPQATVIVQDNIAVGVDTRKLDAKTPQQIILPEGVTEIIDYAFADIEGLIGVTFCDSLERVGKYAFQNCYNLSYVVTNPALQTIDDYAFENLDIISVRLPSNLEYLGVNALNRVNIVNVNVPQDTQLGSGCLDFEFYSLNGEEIIINNLYVKAPTSTSLGEEYTIPEGVTSIEDYAFYYATKIEKVIIPEGVLYIAPFAFLQCTSLNEVVLPSTLVAIDTKAFADCTNLTKVNFNDGLQYIEVDSFDGCNLQDVVIPLTVINRGELEL